MHRIALFVFVAVVATGCASTTVIRSNPSNAKVYDQAGNYVGRTPYTHSDYAIVGHKEIFTVEHDGHDAKTVELVRDNLNVPEAIYWGIGGVIFWPTWTGMLWAFDYEPGYMVDFKREDSASRESVARAK